MADAPNPKTWASDYAPTAADFNTHIKDAINFLITPPRVSVRSTVNQTVPGNLTWTRMSWNALSGAEIEDMWGVDNYKLTARVAGLYQVTLSARWQWKGANPLQTLPSGSRSIMVWKNSNGNLANGSEVCGDHRRVSDAIIPLVNTDGMRPFSQGAQSCTGFVRLNPGDHVEAWCSHGQRDGQLDGTGENVNLDLNHTVEGHAVTSMRFSAVWVQK